ncbi:hypothetical protein CAPTEDRAFT_190872 [Capitella teleta]|uniref:Uncharacterized protein n=1 Tax=Capitella teleta TaxID=283909 RepID=R7UHR2_CAPTE|nr:hypothetical protein CAPTEDRAFT_190872 [Capitella teleta]|eukprot:ELU06064.1 hypothetical protein CAPTEDRAFT_190872 [Capitella teleta]
MTCRTPKLRLSPTNELGSFKAEYRFGFLFKGFGEYQERDDQRNTTTVLTIEVAPVELPPIAKHHWPPHDVTKREPLTLEARKTKLQVQAGNTNGHAGCLSYVASEGAPLTMILGISTGAVTVLIIASIIACCVTRKPKNQEAQ